MRVAAEALLHSDEELCNTILEVPTGKPRCDVPPHVVARLLKHCRPRELQRISALPSTMLTMFVLLPFPAQAGDIKTPHGTLSMCYDSRGALYEVPMFCYSSPSNILSNEEAAAPKRTGHTGAITDVPVTLRLSSTVIHLTTHPELSGDSHLKLHFLRSCSHISKTVSLITARCSGSKDRARCSHDGAVKRNSSIC